MRKNQYMVRVFEISGGPRKYWFDTRMERALWLIKHGYKPDHVLSHSDPANDYHESVFHV